MIGMSGRSFQTGMSSMDERMYRFCCIRTIWKILSENLYTTDAAMNETSKTGCLWCTEFLFGWFLLGGGIGNLVCVSAHQTPPWRSHRFHWNILETKFVMLICVYVRQCRTGLRLSHTDMVPHQQAPITSMFSLAILQAHIPCYPNEDTMLGETGSEGKRKWGRKAEKDSENTMCGQDRGIG